MQGWKIADEGTELENAGPWKMSDESAGLEFDGLAMRVEAQKTQLNESGYHEY